MKTSGETLTQPNLVETTTVDLRKSEALSETEEILNNPEAMESLKKAQEDLKAGKYDKWEDVKQEV